MVTERDHDSALRDLVVERGGERWRVRLHYDGGIEVLDGRQTSVPRWVARAVRRYEFAADE